MLIAGPAEPYRKQLDGFRQGLSNTGYSEGKNVAIEPRWAEADIGRLPALAHELVARNIAVISAMSGHSALAAKPAT